MERYQAFSPTPAKYVGEDYAQFLSTAQAGKEVCGSIELRRAAAQERPSSRRMPSAKRSARAAMVRAGLTPTGPGMTEPSATYRPG